MSAGAGGEGDYRAADSAELDLQATILQVVGSGPSVSALFSSLKVAFLSMNVQTCRPLSICSLDKVEGTHLIT